MSGTSRHSSEGNDALEGWGLLSTHKRPSVTAAHHATRHRRESTLLRHSASHSERLFLPRTGPRPMGEASKILFGSGREAFDNQEQIKRQHEDGSPYRRDLRRAVIDEAAQDIGPPGELTALLDALERELLAAPADEVRAAWRETGRAHNIACQEVRVLLNEAIAASEEGSAATLPPDTSTRLDRLLGVSRELRPPARCHPCASSFPARSCRRH
jgi:hypothetical protein